MRIIQMRETFEQPRPVGARPRERWEIVAREEIHFQNFVVGVWAAARNFAEEDHLEGVMSGQRLASPVASVIRSPIWSCVGKMRMVPGGSGGYRSSSLLTLRHLRCLSRIGWTTLRADICRTRDEPLCPTCLVSASEPAPRSERGYCRRAVRTARVAAVGLEGSVRYVANC